MLPLGRRQQASISNVTGKVTHLPVIITTHTIHIDSTYLIIDIHEAKKNPLRPLLKILQVPYPCDPQSLERTLRAAFVC